MTPFEFVIAAGIIVPSICCYISDLVEILRWQSEANRMAAYRRDRAAALRG